MDNNQKTILIFMLLLLIISNTFWLYRYSHLQKELSESKNIVKVQQVNEKVLNFLKLFIKDVLKAEKEVDFETRLKLENAVRDIQDQEILNQWNKFVQSQTEDEAQRNVKDLLELLVNKIKLQ